jgi:hypothetical protein
MSASHHKQGLQKPLSLSVCLSVCISVCLSVYVSVRPCVCSSVCLPHAKTGSCKQLDLAYQPICQPLLASSWTVHGSAATISCGAARAPAGQSLVVDSLVNDSQHESSSSCQLLRRIHSQPHQHICRTEGPLHIPTDECPHHKSDDSAPDHTYLLTKGPK